MMVIMLSGYSSSSFSYFPTNLASLPMLLTNVFSMYMALCFIFVIVSFASIMKCQDKNDLRFEVGLFELPNPGCRSFMPIVRQFHSFYSLFSDTLWIFMMVLLFFLSLEAENSQITCFQDCD